MSAAIVFKQMTIIFLLIMSGYVVYKQGIIKEEAVKSISSLVVNICNPAMLVQSAFTQERTITNNQIIVALIGGAVLYGLFLVSSFIIPKLLRIESKWRDHYAMMCLFGNTGFIGIPLVAAVLGNEALIYVAIINGYFNLLFYTYGYRLADENSGPIEWKSFLNIGNASIIITIILFMVPVKLPEVVTSTVTYFATPTTFLAMLIIGISLARTNLKAIVTRWKMYPFILLRFLIFPIIVSFVLRLFVKDPMIFGVLVLMSSVPVANLPLMRVEEVGGDSQVLSTGIILSTVCSLVTIPLVVLMV